MNTTLSYVFHDLFVNTNHDVASYRVPFPMQFPSFIHTQKRNPQTHMKDPDMVWDFWSLRPESLHQVSPVWSDASRGAAAVPHVSVGPVSWMCPAAAGRGTRWWSSVLVSALRVCR